MGRKALADNVKQLQGTLQKCRQNPETLSPRAVGVWNKVVPMLEKYGVLSEFDQMAVQNLCETYAEWLTLNEYITYELKGKSSFEVYTREGAITYRPYPEISQRAEVSKRLQSLLSDFGLTPAARSKVNTITKDKKEDPWKDL